MHGFGKRNLGIQGIGRLTKSTNLGGLYIDPLKLIVDEWLCGTNRIIQDPLMGGAQVII
jgi:hypothetical protein